MLEKVLVGVQKISSNLWKLKANCCIRSTLSFIPVPRQISLVRVNIFAATKRIFCGNSLYNHACLVGRWCKVNVSTSLMLV